MNNTNKAIKQAKEVLEKISQDEKEQYLAHLREKYILDQRDLLASGYDKGIEDGIKQGIEQGIKQGKLNKQKEIAKELLNLDIPIKQICKVTKLSEEEINKL